MAASNEVTGKILVERARAMAPVLRERAREAEEARRIPDVTLQDAIDAGLLQALVPKRYGGYEIDFHYSSQITRELAHGCISSAWIISFFNQHNWQLGLFPQAIQERLWGPKPYVLAPAHIIPSGTAQAVDGGYRVNGKWGWGSGINHADWFWAAAVVRGEGPAADARYFAIPVEQTSTEGDWDVAGLGGTGSVTVVVDDIFVADDMQISIAEMLNGSAPGIASHDGILWRIPMVQVLMYNSLVAMAVGAAEAAHEIFIEGMKKKQIKYGGGAAIENSAVHMRAGKTKFDLAMIRNLFDANLAKIWERAGSDDPMSEFEKLEIQGQGSYIVHASRWLVDEICESAGSSVNFLSHPLQRIRRDINVLATHGIANLDRTTEVYGKVLLGHDIPPDALR